MAGLVASLAPTSAHADLVEWPPHLVNPMAFDDHLLPNESVMFTTARAVVVGKTKYTGYLTSERLIFHRRTGLLQRDETMSYRLRDVTRVDYREKGLVRQGVLQIHVQNSKLEARGPAAVVKQLYQQALAATMRPAGGSTSG